MEKKTVLASATITIILIAVAVAFFNQSRAENENHAGTKLYVDPNMIKEETKMPPFTFYVNISIYNVTNMVFCEFNLSYAHEFLTVTRIECSKVQGQYPSPYVNSNSEKGYVYVRLTYKNPVSLPETSASLFYIEFTALDYGVTPLDLNDTSLKDGDGHLIPHEAEDGFVWIIKRDVAIINVSTSTSETYVGHIVNVQVTTQNMGIIAENYKINVSTNGELIAQLQVVDLQPNETCVLAFDWDTSGFAPNMTPYTITAEAEILPYETNTTNNVFTGVQVKIKLVGDINGNGIVNIDDLTLWDAAFNSRPSEPNWNPQADINGDGIVDKEDGILIIQNYQSSLG
ncbi:MAG: CARDB domain-containing protein [Candidatus Bathyarchaeia archaeon]